MNGIVLFWLGSILVGIFALSILSYMKKLRPLAPRGEGTPRGSNSELLDSGDRNSGKINSKYRDDDIYDGVGDDDSKRYTIDISGNSKKSKSSLGYIEQQQHQHETTSAAGVEAAVSSLKPGGVIIVCDAGKGFARQTAIYLAARGFHVLAGVRDKHEVQVCFFNLYIYIYIYTFCRVI